MDTKITIREHVPLRDLTTFRVGGTARFFCEVASVEELQEALKWARMYKAGPLPFFILGGGSNILVADEGFQGLVIKMAIKGIAVENDNPATRCRVAIGAGEGWDSFVAMCVSRGLSGIENLSGIPGTVGAAPVQNIGAYGAEVSAVVERVDTIDDRTGAPRSFTNTECQFAYRESFFKTGEGKHFIITQVHVVLAKTPPLNFSYKDIGEFFNAHPAHPRTLRGLRDAILAIRAGKLPDWHTIGTAGSFFKNPIIARSQYDALKKTYPDLPGFIIETQDMTAASLVKVPLGWIIDHICGYKGVTKGSVGTYRNQALVLVNTGGATATEVKAFAHEIIALVKEKTGIDVESEVQYVG